MISPLTESDIRARLALRSIPDQTESYVFPKHSGIEPKDASVLILLRETEGKDWEMILTRRTDRVESHKGQVSFPGGARDAADADEIATALREVYEEIGVLIPVENILGKVNTRKTVSNFMVAAYVATAPTEMIFAPNPHEVDRVFSVPLSWLRSPENCQSYTHPETQQEVFRFNAFENEVIWGVTAGIIVDLVKILNSGQPA